MGIKPSLIQISIPSDLAILYILSFKTSNLRRRLRVRQVRRRDRPRRGEPFARHLLLSAQEHPDRQRPARQDGRRILGLLHPRRRRQDRGRADGD